MVAAATEPKYTGEDRRQGVQREDIYDKVMEIRTEQKLIRNDLCDVCKNDARHERVLYGNGREGLITTVSKLVDAMNDIKKMQWFIIAGVIGLIIEKLSSLF